MAVNQLEKTGKFLDRLQQKNRISAFVVAVIKKYNDDHAGRRAATLTYYSFLSLFPLLLVLTTITDILIGHDPHLRSLVVKGVDSYFPLLGNQLSNHVHRLHAGNGLALISGLVIMVYGARGVASAFSSSVQEIWNIAPEHRDKFPKNLFKDLAIVIVGGVGLILASVIASLASSAGKGVDFRILSILLNLLILFWLFRVLLNLSLPKRIPFSETRSGAAAAAIGLVILQLVGGYILGRELRHLSALYSYFAVTLGLLFWLYLQAQVLYYAIEVAIVSSRKLWPRALLK